MSAGASITPTLMKLLQRALLLFGRDSETKYVSCSPALLLLPAYLPNACDHNVLLGSQPIMCTYVKPRQRGRAVQRDSAFATVYWAAGVTSLAALTASAPSAQTYSKMLAGAAGAAGAAATA